MYSNCKVGRPKKQMRYPRLIKIEEKDDYVERIEAKMFAQERPLNGQLDLTYRCNLKCRHCFIAPAEQSQTCPVRDNQPKADASPTARISNGVNTDEKGTPACRSGFAESFHLSEQAGISAPRQAGGHLSISGKQRQMTDNQCQSVKISANQCIKKELSTKEVFAILDQLIAAGCLWLCFSGGEVFLREDFLDIYTYARKKGFLISIFTNGTLITTQVADYLARLPPHSIEITLNGIREETYEKVTQIPGSFIKAMQAIQLLKARKLPLVLKCNGIQVNRDEILKIKKFSEELLGKGYFRADLVLYPGIDGSKKPCALRLKVDEILKIQYGDSDMLAFSKEQFLHNEEDKSLKAGYLFPCGLTSFQIDPYGKMRLCLFIEEPYADLKKEEFLNAFLRLYTYFQGLKSEADTKCRSCKIRYLCRQCPGRALAENGDMESPVEFFCELAHKQAQMKERLLNC